MGSYFLKKILIYQILFTHVFLLLDVLQMMNQHDVCLRCLWVNPPADHWCTSEVGKENSLDMMFPCLSSPVRDTAFRPIPDPNVQCTPEHLREFMRDLSRGDEAELVPLFPPLSTPSLSNSGDVQGFTLMTPSMFLNTPPKLVAPPTAQKLAPLASISRERSAISPKQSLLRTLLERPQLPKLFIPRAPRVMSIRSSTPYPKVVETNSPTEEEDTREATDGIEAMEIDLHCYENLMESEEEINEDSEETVKPGWASSNDRNNPRSGVQMNFSNRNPLPSLVRSTWFRKS
jgi:hypothetical protein